MAGMCLYRIGSWQKKANNQSCSILWLYLLIYLIKRNKTFSRILYVNFKCSILSNKRAFFKIYLCAHIWKKYHGIDELTLEHIWCYIQKFMYFILTFLLPPDSRVFYLYIERSCSNKSWFRNYPLGIFYWHFIHRNQRFLSISIFGAYSLISHSLSALEKN